MIYKIFMDIALALMDMPDLVNCRSIKTKNSDILILLGLNCIYLKPRASTGKGV